MLTIGVFETQLADNILSHAKASDTAGKHIQSGKQAE